MTTLGGCWSFFRTILKKSQHLKSKGYVPPTLVRGGPIPYGVGEFEGDAPGDSMGSGVVEGTGDSVSPGSSVSVGDGDGLPLFSVTVPLFGARSMQTR